MNDLKRKYKIYIHTNKINGKKYVGQTNQTLSQRWGKNGKRYQEQSHFGYAIKKYGWDNFKHEVVFENLTLNEANEIEKAMIEAWDLTNPDRGYNNKEGGANGSHTQETRDKISKKLKGHTLSEESRKKMSESLKGRECWCKGKTLPEEHCRKLSETHLGQVAWNKGKPMSEEAKQKLHVARLGKQPTNLRELIEANKRFRQTEEGKKAASLATKGTKWFNNGKCNIIYIQCPEGYMEGRIPATLNWYNNGKINTRAKECPEGFIKGKLNKKKR